MWAEGSEISSRLDENMRQRWINNTDICFKMSGNKTSKFGQITIKHEQRRGPSDIKFETRTLIYSDKYL